ncbi:phage tail tape measure protein [Bacteroides sp. ET489]|uniref:phage tail tape measure protein n=1 Tax=Bacteroides sp. ET489 TaxID=3057126 RepID=UPI002673C92F|nr:phage tail tape measure protein [Bacteroides sp. ET489]MDO3389996.1 phage tail tape measure protein [Bacteroides sp. ET489]
MAKSKSEKRGVYLYIDGQEIINNVNHIEKECRQLTQQLNSMTIGSEEYNRQMQKIQHLKGILREHRNEIRGVTEDTKKSTISVGKLVDGFNRFGGIIVTVIGFLTGVTLALRSFRDERNKLEESQAGLKALTGLDDDSITWLTRQAKQLSTTMTKEGLRVRQSASEILDAYMLVGSAKPELLGNKEALAAVTEEAMRLQAAAKDIKLSEAVDALTLSLNQYGAAADQAGRFANVLAAGSKEGAANIASQARTIRNAGVAAASANVSIEQTVGLIETLAEKGIKDEVAGTGLKKFFLVLQTGADDVNPKIVGLNQALDNLAAKNMGAKAIKDMFGEEGYNVASVIMQNIDKVKQYTAAVTDTNIAYEQAAINSNTAAAALDQARNKMKLAAIELGEKLNPAFTVSTNLATNLLKVLPDLIDWLQKYAMTFVTMLAPVVAYTAATKAATLWQTRLKDAKLLDVAASKLQNMWNKTLRNSTLLLAAAKNLLTGRITTATKAWRLFSTAIKANPVGLFVSLITAAAGAVYLLATRSSESTKNLKEMYGEMTNEQVALDGLFSALKRTTEGSQDRRDIIQQINDKYGTYLPNLLTEKSSLDDINDAYKRINDTIVSQIALKYKNEEIGKITAEAAKTQVDAVEEMRTDLVKSLGSNELAMMAINDVKQITNEFYSAGMKWQDAFGQAWHTIKAKYLGGNSIANGFSSDMEDFIRSVYNMNSELSKVESKFASWMPVQKKNKLPEVTVTATRINTSTVNGSDTDPDKFAAAEAAYYRRIAAIKKKYLDDDKMTQTEYNRQMQDAELALLNDKLRVAGLEPKERQQIADQILDTQIKLRDDLHKQEEKEAEENSKQTSTRLQKQYQLAVESATMQHYQLRTSEEDFYEELRRLQDEYFRQVLDDTTVSEEEKNKIREEMRKRDLKDAKDEMEQETNERRKQYEKQKRMADMYVNIVSSAGQDLGDALSDLLKSQDDAMKNMWKQLLLTAVNAIEQYIRLTYIKVLADSIIRLKFVKALGALAKIAAIETAFAAVKGAIGNFYTGGFTPSGDWDQPQGLVHSNEFVANRFAVANPHLRPIFDVIDVAQRSGNVANLTADDIAAVASGSRASAAPSAPMSFRDGNTATANDPALAAMLAECTRTLRRLKQRLDEPITAETYLTGKGGINEAQKEYTKIQNNKSRHRNHD